MKVEFTDRYQALGIPYPDAETMCLGMCEGTGYVPVKKDEEDDKRLVELWEEQEKIEPSDDGWHFVLCPDCNGTRLRKGAENMKRKEDKISASEALFGFAAWLTTRDQRTVLSSIDNAAIAADLVGKFCKVNELANPKEDFHKRFKMPESEYISSLEELCNDRED